MTSEDKTTGKSKSVYPHHYHRIEMASGCRHGLSSSERHVLIVLAERCNHQRPWEAEVSVEYMAQRIGCSTRTVDRALAVLVKKELIRRHLTGKFDEIRMTKMNWELINSDQFRYVPKQPTRKQQDAQLEDFAPISEPTKEALEQPSEKIAEPSSDGEDFDDALLDAPTKQPTADIDPELVTYLDRLLPWLEAGNSAYVSPGENGCPASLDLHQARQFCKPYGLLVDQRDSSFRMALPLHEAAALRLSEHAGIQVHKSQLQALHKFKIDDPYLTLEHAFDAEPWSSMLKKSKGAGLLVSMFEQIEADAVAADPESIAGEESIAEPPIEETKSFEQRPKPLLAKKKLVFEDSEDAAPVEQRELVAV